MKVILRFSQYSENFAAPYSGLNFIFGSNGQGKTSVLEAISYLSTLRSFRGAKTNDVITRNSPHSVISCYVVPDEEGVDWRTELKISFQAAKLDFGRSRSTKTAFINGKPFKSSAQYLSSRFGNFRFGFHTITFNPSDHDLVRGDPADRRSYLDRVLAASHVDYFEALQRFHRILEQRNALLKDGDRGSSTRDLWIDFTQQMAHISSRIVLTRLEWVSDTKNRLKNALQKICPFQSNMSLNTPLIGSQKTIFSLLKTYI